MILFTCLLSVSSSKNIRPLLTAVSLVPVTVSEMLNEYLLLLPIMTHHAIMGHNRQEK